MDGSWRAWSGLDRLLGWSPKEGAAASDSARASGEGESLEQAVVILESNAPHLLGWDPEMEDEGMGSWKWKGWWDLWDLICWMGGWLD